jgi:hypothetical protein
VDKKKNVFKVFGTDSAQTGLDRKQNNYNVFNGLNIFRRSSESYGFEHGPDFQRIYSYGEGCKCTFELQQV